MTELRNLATLEQLVGVSSTINVMDGNELTADTAHRCAVLRALGHDVRDVADAPTALLVEERRRAAQVVPTVLVAWEGSMRAPVECPDGLAWTITPTDLNDPTDDRLHTGLTADRTVAVDGLSFGFHTLSIDVKDHAHTALVISAPTRAFGLPRHGGWGIRVPLENIAQLAATAEPIVELGASVIAVGAFHATHAEAAHHHDPLSRRWFDPRFAGDAADQLQIDSGATAPSVDDDSRLAEWARFRAAQDRYGQDWRMWPDAAANGDLSGLPLDDEQILCHALAQQDLTGQLEDLTRRLRTAGADLGVELPAGASIESFDVWSRQSIHATEFRVGLPQPGESSGLVFDTIPVIPEAARVDGHLALREVLEANMASAGVLRLSRASSLERTWWSSIDGSNGVWIHEPMLELLAVLTVLSHRHRCAVVAEDLGGTSERLAAAFAHHGVSMVRVATDRPEALPGGEAVVDVTSGRDDLNSWWKSLDRATRTDLAGRAGTDATESAPDSVVHQLLERVGHSDAPLVIAPLDAFEAPDDALAFLPTLGRARSEASQTSWPPPGWWFGAQDQHLFNEGSHTQLWHSLGGRPDIVDGIAGLRFAVWAPNARAVHVFGDFNGWSKPGHPMRRIGASGVWDAFVPGAGAGTRYKYAVEGTQGRIVEKADPLAFKAEAAPSTASIVTDLHHDWTDGDWMRSRHERNRWDQPISIYEVHLGSWRRHDDRPMSYSEHVDELVTHVADMGFTHVELLPITEHPLYASWGYQTTGYFAATSRYGDPTELMALIDAFHEAGVGVILDWVPSHFPTDEFALDAFDGSHLYEHADPREGFHPDWKSSIFNYGRHEVRSFLLSSARFWLEVFHIDGIRVDAVASMLYRDYSRGDDWVPNRYGGRENLEAIEFLQQLNHEMYAAHPDILMIAEESTAWPGVTKPTDQGGLGFGWKWDMGWMNDSLEYFSLDPIHRQWHHNKLTFRAMYGFSENYVLPLSHDEVVHGKGSLLNKMPGDDWQKFANLRTLLGWQYSTPGKKLLFMGSELAPWTEWNHDDGLPWHLTDAEGSPHEGMLQWVSHLNHVYRTVPALHAGDATPAGFSWIDADDSARSILSFLRTDPESGESVVIVLNNTPVTRSDVMVGVPRVGEWEVIASSDDARFGGAGTSHPVYETTKHQHNAFPQALWLTLPALSITILRQRGPGRKS